MADIGFLSEKHMIEYIEARADEAMKEGLTKYPIFMASKPMHDAYIVGFLDALKFVGNVGDDIKKLTEDNTNGKHK